MRSVFVTRPDGAEARRQTSGWGSIGVWLPAAIACVVIVMESTETMGANHTSSWLRPIFEKVFGPFQDESWHLFHHVLRKAGHFFGYGLVCLAFLRAWLWTLARREALAIWAWRWRSCLLGIACTFVVASGDEFHQTLVPGRAGQFSDVILDTCGGLLMCLVVWAVFWAGRSGTRSGSARMQEG